MKKILLLLTLSNSLNAENIANKTENQQGKLDKKEQKFESSKNENRSKENKQEKPEHLEINSIALDIATKKFEREKQFLNDCDGLAEELKKQNLVIEGKKKLYNYSSEELEKVLNIIKLRKKEIRNIQITIMNILGEESKIEDFYLDEKDEKLSQNDQNNSANEGNKNSMNNSLDSFSEYFKDYENKEEKEKIRNKIASAKKIKIDFKDFEKSSQDSIKRLSSSYYKIIDIIMAKLILDNVEGKTWQERKHNFKKELPNIQKTETKINEKRLEDREKNKKKINEKSNEKVEAKDESKEIKKEEKSKELKDEIDPKHKKIIDTNFTYILFPLYSYSSFNPYSVALDIEKTWKKKGLMD